MATELKHTNVNEAPEIQKGICRQLPEGYGGPSVHWEGRASQLAANGGYVKLPEGFKATELIVKLTPVEDRAAAQHTNASAGTDVALVEDGTLAIPDGSYKVTAASYQLDVNTGAWAAAATGKNGSVSGNATVTVANGVAPVASVAVSGTNVVDDAGKESYVKLTMTAPKLDSATADCFVAVYLRLAQVDPEPKQMY